MLSKVAMVGAAAPLMRVVSRRSSHDEPSGPLKRTPLYELNKDVGAKFVPFCGWEMPVQYEGMGVKKETAACRNGAAIFDVSHMGQVRIFGPDRERFIEKLTVADVTNTPYGTLRYTIIPNANGGTIDDAVVARLQDHLHLVINSACFDKDMKHFAGFLSEFPGVQLEPLYDTHALIAVQGPKAAETIAKFLDEEDVEKLSKLPFMSRMRTTLCGFPGIVISRCGYTGEDGFELSMPIRVACDITKKIAACKDVAYAGLGARDALRLEAALSLYGHDLNDDITLVEAGQAWTVTKRRREQGGFIGAETILRQIQHGVTRKRIGLVAQGAPVRDGAAVHNKDGKKIGVITSGSPSPTLQKNIALGFIDSKFAKVGTDILVNVRGKMQSARVTKTPFFPHRYPSAGKQ